jgi:hypothetical protein
MLTVLAPQGHLTLKYNPSKGKNIFNARLVTDVDLPLDEIRKPDGFEYPLITSKQLPYFT